MAEAVQREIVMMYKEDLVALFKEIASAKGDEDVVLTTPEVMDKYKIASRTTLNTYHSEGLRYIKGSPNKYRLKDLETFFKTKKTI